MSGKHRSSRQGLTRRAHLLQGLLARRKASSAPDPSLKGTANFWYPRLAALHLVSTHIESASSKVKAIIYQDSDSPSI